MIYTSNSKMIRNVRVEDAEAITTIYNFYVLNSIATLEEHVVSVDYYKDKIETVTQKFPWLVFEYNNEIIGYAYASSWNTRSSYSKTVETSVYVKDDCELKGIGTILYKALIDTLKNQGFCALIGGISMPNEASVKLHEKFGFEKVGHFKQVGYKFNKWVDVGYWQLTFKE